MWPLSRAAGFLSPLRLSGTHKLNHIHNGYVSVTLFTVLHIL